MPLPAFLIPLLTKAGGAAASGSASAGASSLIPKLLGSAKSNPASSLGAGKGLMQLVSSMRSKGQANALTPPLYDAQQLAMLADIQQRKNAYNTGSAFAADMGAIDATTAGTQDAITQVTGGDVGGTIQALLSSQSAGGRAKNQVLARGDQGQFAMGTLAADMQRQISGRALELQMAMRQQKLAEWAQSATDANANLFNAAARSEAPKIDWMELMKIAQGNKAAMPTTSAASFAASPETAARSLTPVESTLPLDSGMNYGDDDATLEQSLLLNAIGPK